MIRSPFARSRALLPSGIRGARHEARNLTARGHAYWVAMLHVAQLTPLAREAQRCCIEVGGVPARFPELNKTITRSPRRSNTVILQNLAMLSMPALVRESEAKIIPLSSITPIQYVMPRTPY